MNEVQQIAIALYGSNKKTRSEFIKLMKVVLKFEPIIINMDLPIVNTVLGCGVFKIGQDQFSEEKINEPIFPAIVVSDKNIKDIIFYIYQVLGAEANFNPYKIGINNFNKQPILTGKDLLKFMAYEIIGKLSPNFTSIMTYGQYQKQLGLYVINNIKFLSEIKNAETKFQLTFPLFLKGRERQEVDVYYDSIRDKTNTFPAAKIIELAPKGKIKEEYAAEVIAAIEELKNKKIAEGTVQGFQAPVQQSGEKEVIKKADGTLQIGKVVFGYDKPWPKDKIIY